MNAERTSRSLMESFGDDECQLVTEELKTVLQFPQFTSSRRYPAFLKFVVERTLVGQTEELKERTLGIEVFGKKPDYDTNSDTVVRFTAGEVRKRLALVYQDDVRRPSIQIVMPVGKYVPEFYRLSGSELSPTVPEQAYGQQVAPAGTNSPWAIALMNRKPKVWWMAACAALVVLIGLFAAIRTRHADQTSAQLFWRPVRAANVPVIVSTGAVVVSKSSDSGIAMASKGDDYPYVSLATARTIAQISDLLGQSGIPYRVESTSSVSLTDLRNHPVVLIGAYTNDWTLRLSEDLRYRFSDKAHHQIYDSQNPDRVWHTKWLSVNDKHERIEDYAIVARMQDKLTENTVIMIAGLGPNGTEVAAQFATQLRYLDLLDHAQAGNWDKKNVEVVLKATVIDSKTSAPTIEAVYIW